MPRITTTCALLMICGLPAAAQVTDRHTHRAGTTHAGSLGDVSFENSGGAAAQEPFLRGLALLHSFEYEEAAEAFLAAQTADPAFAMAYWGEALTYAHLLWGEDDPASARAALTRLGPTPEARLGLAGSVRERAYGAAVEAFFADADLAQRAHALADSLRRVLAAYPDDVDALAFGALSLMFTEYVGMLSPEQRHAARNEAITLAERAYAASPTHPGAVHYLIHATDDPDFAARGEAAARSYAELAPDAEHALHMPSHIFLQLGLWDEVVASNERAWAASRAEIAARGGSNADVSFHALQWLQYGYLQQGRYHEARALADTARAVLHGLDLSDAQHVDARYIVAELEFVHAANTGEWSARACERVHLPRMDAEPASDRERSFRTVALVQSVIAEMRCTGREGEAARALRAAASSNDAAAAPMLRTSVTLLDAVARQTRGDHAGASALLAPLADAPVRPPVGPPLLPRVHELLAESMMAQARPRDAAALYERALRLTPNRAAALIGLARAHAAVGDRAAAASAWRRLLVNWHRSDADLEVLAEARRMTTGS